MVKFATVIVLLAVVTWLGQTAYLAQLNNKPFVKCFIALYGNCEMHR